MGTKSCPRAGRRQSRTHWRTGTALRRLASTPAGRATANRSRPTRRWKAGPGTGASNSPANRHHTMFIHPSYRRWSGADERTVRARHPLGPVATGPYQGVHAFLVTCLIAVAAIATTARAQAPDLNEPSVTLAVSPSEVPVNGHVSISGLGYPQPGTPVSITVTGPSGPPTTATSTPDKNGKYSLTFYKTPVAGSYTVSAQIGAKGTPAKGSFTVKTYLIDIDED